MLSTTNYFPVLGPHHLWQRLLPVYSVNIVCWQPHEAQRQQSSSETWEIRVRQFAQRYYG